MNTQKIYTILLWCTFVSVWALTILHLLAMKFHLYWIFSWFDIMMHGIGGITVGFFVGAVLVRIKSILIEHAGLLLILIITGTIFIGLLWESLEFILDIYMGTHLYQPSVGDTILDLVMDGVGALVAGLVTIKIIKKYE